MAIETTACQGHLKSGNLYDIVGQILLYREAINPQARAVIIAYSTLALARLRSYIEQLGVEIIV